MCGGRIRSLSVHKRSSRRLNHLTEYQVRRHGATALALVEHVRQGGPQNVATFRKILQKAAGVSPQGTAGFWTNGPDGLGLVYRTQNSGYPITSEQPAALTKRCHQMAEAYTDSLAEASPDEEFWLGVAEHLQGLAGLIRKRFGA
jgi:hypothetical protein